jgi:RimJ/RimL family protein N-acetyltransferase
VPHRQNFQLGIIDSKTNRLLGSCGVRTKGSLPGEGDFGIGIAPDRWATGIAQDAAKTILRFGFSELGLKEVHAVTVSDNDAVTKFARPIGFSAGRPREGDAWMTERGWKAVDWSITRDVWGTTHGA